MAPISIALGKMLAAAGAHVWRVGFNRGDRAFWPSEASYIAYKGTLQDWPLAFRTVIEQKADHRYRTLRRHPTDPRHRRASRPRRWHHRACVRGRLPAALLDQL